ncbi:MAG: hypothetical protein ACD_39C00194G0001 [uncultured bacterium]|nr:MAG: hypothetical protein ACD_39C00194G0001 [uncultured bacterium]
MYKKTGLMIIALMLVANSLLAGSCVIRVLSAEHDCLGTTFQVENLSTSERMPVRFAINMSFSRFKKDSIRAVRVGEILKVIVEPAELEFNCLHFEVAPATRDISEGHIHEIIFAGEGADPEIQGMMTVLQKDGSLRPFIVHKYTLILVKSLSDNLYAGRLDQLRTGWKCSIGFDIPDDDDNYDFTGKSVENQPKIADNMIVEYVPPAP